MKGLFHHLLPIILALTAALCKSSWSLIIPSPSKHAITGKHGLFIKKHCFYEWDHSPSNSKKKSLLVLYEANNDLDEYLEKGDHKEPKKDNILRQVAKSVAYTSYLAFSFLLQFIVIVLSFNILLNLAGYDYVVDYQDNKWSFRVDTMENLRMERQLESEEFEESNE